MLINLPPYQKTASARPFGLWLQRVRALDAA
jgi:hypothetical protein